MSSFKFMSPYSNQKLFHKTVRKGLLENSFFKLMVTHSAKPNHVPLEGQIQFQKNMG